MGGKSGKNLSNWSILYKELAEFIKRQNRMPARNDSSKLYTWCAVQRLKNKKNALSADKIADLNKIGFIWNVQDHIWQENLKLLQKYRKKNPERWPSQRSHEPLEHKLAVWFLGIRKDFKRNKLAPERIKKLREIGFPFYPRQHRWSKTLDQLKDFIENHNRFPDKTSQINGEQRLYNWIKYQVIKMEFEVLDSKMIQELKKINIEKFISKISEK